NGRQCGTERLTLDTPGTGPERLVFGGADTLSRPVVRPGPARAGGSEFRWAARVPVAVRERHWERSGARDHQSGGRPRDWDIPAAPPRAGLGGSHAPPLYRRGSGT